MTYLLLQTFLLLLSAYFLGAFLACLAKRMVTRRAERAAAAGPREAFAPAAARTMDIAPLSKPRAIDPVQPRIDILPRPEPKAAPAQTSLDTSRFDRALTGPDANAGMPRRMIVEIRPAILKSPTGPAQPLKPAEKPAPVPAPAAVKAAPATVQAVPVVLPQPKPAPAAQPAAQPGAQTGVQAKPVQPAPAATPQSAPSSSAGAAMAGAGAATAAAAAAVAAAKAAAAAATAPRPVIPAPAPAPVAAKPVIPAATVPAPAPAAPAVKPAAPVAQQPVPAPQPAASQVAPQPLTGGDDLQRIRAIDADTERRLHGIGVKRFDDMAIWTPADINRVNQALGLTGRIDREQWIEQAQILAKGGETYYSRNRAAAARGGAPAPSTSTQTVAPAAASSAAAAAPAASATPPVAQTAAPQPAAPAAKPATPAASSSPQPPQRSVAEMAAAAAAAIAAASASVTRGIRPIEPISPMTRANPNISMPARLSDALKEKDAKPAASAASGATLGKDASASAASRASTGKTDDLKRIRGVGVLIERQLNARGVTSYAQVANWTNAEIDRISQDLDFKGRIERENWIEQARILSSGGQTEFSRRVDRGDVETSRDPDES